MQFSKKRDLLSGRLLRHRIFFLKKRDLFSGRLRRKRFLFLETLTKCLSQALHFHDPTSVPLGIKISLGFPFGAPSEFMPPIRG